VYVINKSDRPGADKLRTEVEVMLGIRQGNAFRHVRAHHHAPRADGRTGSRAVGHASPDRLSAGPPDRPEGWEPPVICTVASRGEGVAALADALDRHYGYLEAGGRLVARRRERLAQRTRAALERGVRQWIAGAAQVEDLLERRLDDVVDGRRTPYDVAAEILDQMKAGAGR
jgi:GTPase